MFWGLVLEPSKKYTQKVEQSFHISQAALELSTADSEPVQLILEYDGANFVLATLTKKWNIYQVPLDLNFNAGDQISFRTIGKGRIHLTGYHILEDDFGDMMMNGEEESDVEEDAAVKLESPVLGKRKRLQGVDVSESSSSSSLSGKKAKKNSSNEDESSTEEEDDFDEEDDDEMNDSDDDEDLEMEEFDDDDEEDDDDDDDEEEEDEEEQESFTIKKGATPSKKLNKSDVSINGKDKKMNDKGKGAQNLGKKNNLTPAKESLGSSQKPSKNDKKSPKSEKKAHDQKKESSPQKRVIEGGVVVEEMKVGEGQVAKPGRMVQVYYVGRLQSSKKQFDATTQGPGFRFRLGKGEVIRGWDIGVNGMKVGGKRRITIPAQLAYGAKGSLPAVPPNSTLIFDVELKGVS